MSGDTQHGPYRGVQPGAEDGLARAQELASRLFHQTEADTRRPTVRRGAEWEAAPRDKRASRPPVPARDSAPVATWSDDESEWSGDDASWGNDEPAPWQTGSSSVFADRYGDDATATSWGSAAHPGAPAAGRYDTATTDGRSRWEQIVDAAEESYPAPEAYPVPVSQPVAVPVNQPVALPVAAPMAVPETPVRVPVPAYVPPTVEMTPVVVPPRPLTPKTAMPVIPAMPAMPPIPTASTNGSGVTFTPAPNHAPVGATGETFQYTPVPPRSDAPPVVDKHAESDAAALAAMEMAITAGEAIVRESAEKARQISEQAESFVGELLNRARQEADSAHDRAQSLENGIPARIGEYEQAAYMRIIQYKEDMDAELDSMKKAMEEDDRQRRIGLNAEVESVWRTVEQMITRLWQSVHEEVEGIQAGIDAERHRAELDVAGLRQQAEVDYQEAIASGRRQAQQQLDQAASQVVAAEKTVQAMVAEARVQAERIRRDADSEALAKQAEIKVAMADEVSQIQTENQERLRKARTERDSILGQARDEAQELRDQAERRIARQDAEATDARNRALSAMEQMRREAADQATRSRQEAVDIVAQARQDAEDIRNEVRDYMDRARSEVANLERRRNNISAQLGQLSGVIEALAVPETPARQ